jgi:glycosyltransferase domain-containing protein
VRIEPRLTIVLPLKGRPLFTLRFLWHANRVRMPFRFLIADGEVRPPLSDILENAAKHFPELDIEYVRYPDDASFSRYFAKMHDAMRRVRTPYVMLADNDDLLAPAGIERAMEFLDSHADYVCCGGGIAGFSVKTFASDPLGMPLGPLSRLNYRYAPDSTPDDINASSALERAVSAFRSQWIFYAVYRAPAQEIVWREIAEMDLSTLHLMERFCAMRALTLGKARVDQTAISYFKQADASPAGHWSASEADASGSFVYHLLRSRFSSDFAAIAERVSDAVVEADGGTAEEAMEHVRSAAEPWLEYLIRSHYGGLERLRALRNAVRLRSWLKARYRSSITLDYRNIRQRLRRNGAAEDYLAAFQSELAWMEETVKGEHIRCLLAQLPGVAASGSHGLMPGVTA